VVEQLAPFMDCPSPKFQPQVSAPVPPDVVVERLTGCPLDCGFGVAVGVVTLGTGLTVTTTEADDEVTPRVSVALTVTVNEPVAA